MKLTAVGMKLGVVWKHPPEAPITSVISDAPAISAPETRAAPPIFNDLYLIRLRNGEHETAQHFYQYSRRLLRNHLWGKVPPERADELIQDAISAAMEKIMQGEPRDASRLPAYVRAIGSNMAKQAMRPGSSKDFVELDFERISDTARTPETLLQASETSEAVHEVLHSLPKRDREVLVDLFFNQFDRDEVCQKYHVTRCQLRLILFHARGRFQKLWRKQ